MSNTPRFDAAYAECLDDTGKITRLEPLYNLARRLEFEVGQLKCDSVYCPKCGGYRPGHATGAGDICTCL